MKYFKQDLVHNGCAHGLGLDDHIVCSTCNVNTRQSTLSLSPPHIKMSQRHSRICSILLTSWGWVLSQKKVLMLSPATLEEVLPSLDK